VAGIYKDLTNQVFGRLTVLKYAGATKAKKAKWECLCSCGKKKTVVAGDLNSGRTRSCGCLQSEANIKRITKHGMSQNTEYEIWCGIIKRCTNPNTSNFANYGGRGITICDQWRKSFETFYKDMGPRPSLKHSIDRIDNEKGYFLENCRWATRTQQVINSRTRKDNFCGRRGVSPNNGKYQATISINGKTICLGIYNTIEEATKARKQGEIKYWRQASPA